MPTLLEVEGFRFFFFSHEPHEPSHVHVERGEGRAKFWLWPVELVYARDVPRAEVRRARELTVEHADEFRRRWAEYFGRR